ncbi:MAG: helix-turn-helix domain-containing protein [Haloarculaceae archaeon]
MEQREPVPDTGIVAEFSVASPSLILWHATTAMPEARVETKYHAATGSDAPYLFYAVRSDDFDAFERALAEDPSVRNPRVVARTDGERVYRVEPDSSDLLVPEIARQGGALLDATCRDGRWLARVQLPDADALADAREYCEARDIEFVLHRLYHADGADGPAATGLTPAQREALLVAFEEGYFEEPRRTSLEELATLLGISPTAVGGRLRRGTARLVETTLLPEAEPP